MAFHTNKGYKPKPSLLVSLLKFALVMIVLFCVAVAGSLLWFQSALQPPSLTSEPREVMISQGETIEDITTNLKAQGVIKSTFATQLYTRLYHANDVIQAGAYFFDGTESSKTVIKRLVNGDVSQNYVTFIPGSRLGAIKQSLLDAGYSSQASERAIKRSNYNDHPLVVEYLPDNADLEGYLYPETYVTNNSTSASEVVTSALDAMYASITPDIESAIAKQGLTVHEAIILASVIEKEVSDPLERRQVAQVFLTRLENNVALESNATDAYPDNYNTYEIPGLPPGPLSNISSSSLEAVVNPTNTKYFYFVTGSDCTTRFSATLAEHEQLQREFGVGCE